MASVKASRAGLWCGALTPSRRCCGRKPEGPPPEPFGKPPRALRTSSGDWGLLSVSRGGAASGAGARPAGCLALKARRVSVVPGAAPSAVRAAAAGPKRLSSTRAKARLLRSSLVFSLLGRLLFFGALSSQRESRSPASHRLRRALVCWPVSLRWRLPLRALGQSTTLGKSSTSNHVSSHLVVASCDGLLPSAVVARCAAAKTRVRAVVHRSRQHLGTWRSVGRLVRRTVSAGGLARPMSRCTEEACSAAPA